MKVDKDGNTVYPAGKFGSFKVMSYWQSRVTAAESNHTIDLEQTAYNLIWESEILKRDSKTALFELKAGINPRIAKKGGYFDFMSKRNFSIVEQLNYYDGSGFAVLQGQGWRTNTKTFGPIPVTSEGEAHDFLFQNGCHLSQFISQVTRNDKGEMASMNLNVRLLLATFRPRGDWHPEFVAEFNDTWKYNGGEADVDLNQLAMAFIPLDTVPRARFTKAQFQDYNTEKGWWDDAAPCTRAEFTKTPCWNRSWRK